MKTILTVLVYTVSLAGFAQTKTNEKLTADFFYGTWTYGEATDDVNSKPGFTLTKENELVFLTPNESHNEGPENLDVDKLKWRYQLFLDKTPYIEVTCTHCDGMKIPKFVAYLEIINDRQMYATTVEPNGERNARQLLTRN